MPATFPCLSLKQKPLVSVILDNYNYAQYLPEALASVSVQTCRDFELIIVDDGSTDNSRDILQVFVKDHADADFSIKLILQENGGQSAALNAGFLQSEGDIICFLDSDDVWFPNKLEKIVCAHFGQTNQIVNHIVHHVETIDFSCNPALFDYATPPDPKPYARTLTGFNWHEVLMQYGYMCHHSSCSSMSYSREILSRILPLSAPENMRFCTDTVIFTCCLSLVNMYKLDEVLSYYRMHEDNIYARKYSGARDQELTEKIRAYCNFQCASKGLPAIPFHPSKYFVHLLSDFCETHLQKDLISISAGDRDFIQNRPLAIYGTASAGMAFYDVLRKKNVPICCFVDSDPKRQGTVLCGLPVIGPQEIRSHGVLALIASWASRDITEGLHTLGLVRDEDYVTFCL